jgi:hypothetical protein
MLFTIGAIMPPSSRSPRIIPYENSAITWPRSSLTGSDVSLFGIAADWGRDSGTSGAPLPTGVVALSLLVGLTVALAALPAAGPWLHGSGGHD